MGHFDTDTPAIEPAPTPIGVNVPHDGRDGGRGGGCPGGPNRRPGNVTQRYLT